MIEQKHFDVIIVGGSYSGLSAAMSLGRSLREVLVIDSGLPCNRQTPHSHNFITHDGEKPAVISAKAKVQVDFYDTVQFYNGLVVSAIKTENGFEIKTESGKIFTSRKVLFATGVKDLLPEIDGFKECWGISVLHCPYCHGYEVKKEKMAIISNGEMGFEFAKLISNWTKDLKLCTNGKSTLTLEQTKILKKHNVQIFEEEIDLLEHKNGEIKNIIFKNQGKVAVKAIYARPPFEQHCQLPKDLGCDINEQGLLKVDTMQKTNISGIYASGDCVTQMRSVAIAVSTGSFAGAVINKDLIDEDF
ncbi:NAD(P)/FAD-dependent oxidoreductase [Flavobacterium hibernum]|uniref:Pyridine nucleotide-disulfide oxidoreductase n=1 Tax=Flavobacterium hibernum TaxID=37752 RepID=A0A0D0ERB6_9FLAO|nr:NAD(P)/FAD-dependent oxidoreductase [Flavobacterium hibernum]KIO50653.1 pyridine nucleotide-disulfide oxidoreductase [Flavobacterium hibernum]OXA87521.1 pyridine nucleotide-disulfide oxidoreductase [Flavobacterium hibernum]STO14393.1 Thioredoxin reductase [Flavobacterium hibernum]